ncbi:MAG: ACT domain-containing protein [Nanoarchaeota archaeon]
MKLEDYLKNGKIFVRKGTFAIVKSRKSLPNFFAVVKDGSEITCVIDQSKIKINENIIKIEKNWKILTLDIVFPLNVVGVTAKISSTLSKADVSIFPISAYSRDHFLIKEMDLSKTIKALRKIGLTIKINQ